MGLCPHAPVPKRHRVSTKVSRDITELLDYHDIGIFSYTARWRSVMIRNTHLLVVAMITLASVACATPPQAQVDAANAALTKATAAGATEYAPEAYRAAQDARAKLDAEL